MARFGPDHFQCTCIPLGCSTRQFIRDGETHSGRLFHRTNYPRHLMASQACPANSLQQSSELTAQVNPVATVCPSIGHTAMHITAQVQAGLNTVSRKKRHRSPNESEGPSTSSSFHRQQPIRKHPRLESKEINNNETGQSQTHGKLTSTIQYAHKFDTRAFYTSRTLLQHTSCVQSMIHVLHNYILKNQAVNACQTSLRMEHHKLQTLLARTNANSEPIWKEIPLTVKKLVSTFHLDVRVLETVSCTLSILIKQTFSPSF
ncbi:uncharacterized protein MELLADRAFT_69511 [Melampsora larici-populina 98AG31]|uniref:Uncharacterized protein n=1 Tax=Melampsora larici-populina (strain 98AG31 / pathotype 3-4-7) TaxID=747676 RepID=F4SB05_MELLP|nr:uncharacterized protein MELLADRAFT_69511 [Melampsora larici-populina 98AG31]EGF98173.1 hypothetical protein MELLADRAFT_69511 [Melampsora larici-populina 98AG31]